MKNALLAGALLFLLPYSASADSSPQGMVRGYFAALEHKDFNRARGLTAGSALTSTEHMVGTLAHEAARHHAQVELKVRALQIVEGTTPTEDLRRVPVQVTFDIDVIGRKWIFHRLARKLSGTAQFLVDEHAESPRIVAILGNLE